MVRKDRLAAFADEAGGDLDSQIAALTENGITYLEIRNVDGENIADLTAEKARQVRKRLDSTGISVWSLGSPYGKIAVDEDFAPHLEKFKHGLELAEILGAGHIRLFSFYVPAGREESSRDEVMRRMEQFLLAAKGSGITLCHENEKGIYGSTAPRCEELHRAFPELRAVFDPANFIQCGQDVPAAWEKLEPYVEYMHVKDALADGTVVPAGMGIGELPNLLRRYGGQVLTVEPHLTVFQGFEKLEAGQKTHSAPVVYPTPRAAFDAAVKALKDLL